jgi:hypothetical protein
MSKVLRLWYKTKRLVFFKPSILIHAGHMTRVTKTMSFQRSRKDAPVPYALPIHKCDYGKRAHMFQLRHPDTTTYSSTHTIILM